MYDSQQGQGRETGGCEGGFSNVRKSGESRAMDVGKVKGERKADV